jgi:hypothetical protein
MGRRSSPALSVTCCGNENRYLTSRTVYCVRASRSDPPDTPGVPPITLLMVRIVDSERANFNCGLCLDKWQRYPRRLLTS